jgi:hypothetical protein
VLCCAVLVSQAILNVTRDATRVADLLEDFFTQQQREVHGDPALRDKFLVYMAAQANTSYSVVDNKLSWVLWLYSMIWMPLLIVLCFMRASRSVRPPGGSSGKAAAGAAHHQQLLLRSASTASTPQAALSAAPNGLLLPSESVGAAGAHQQQMLRHAAAAAAAEQCRRSSGGSADAAAAPGRGLRRYASVAQHQLQRNSSSSDSLRSQQVLPPSASLPAHLLVATGSSSSIKGAAGGSSSSRLGTRRLDAPAGDEDVYGDVCPAADQCSGLRSSTAGGSTHILRSGKARLQQEAVNEQYGWQALS